MPAFLLSNDSLKAQSPLSLKGWEPPRKESWQRQPQASPPGGPRPSLGFRNQEVGLLAQPSVRLIVLRDLALLSSQLAKRQANSSSSGSRVAAAFFFLESSVLATVIGPWQSSW